MDVYIYDADIYCRSCGEAIRDRIESAGCGPDEPDDEGSYDSGDYPKGPFDNGGGEADSPQHCEDCGVFLENPLTAEGEKYVRKAYDELGSKGREFPEMWMNYYDLHRKCEWCGQNIDDLADDAKLCTGCQAEE